MYSNSIGEALGQHDATKFIVEHPTHEQLKAEFDRITASEANDVYTNEYIKTLYEHAVRMQWRM